MIGKLKKFTSSSFFQEISIVVIGMGLANFFNLLYHFALVRLLSSEDYGVINTLISLTLFFSIIISPIQPTLTKFLSEYFAYEEFDKMYLLLKLSFRKLFLLSVIIFLGFVILSPNFTNYFNIENKFYFILIGAFIGMSVLYLPIYSFFQSSQFFKKLSLLNIISVFFKLAIGIGLILLDFGIWGGLIGYLASPFLILLIGGFLTFFFFKEKKININISKINSIDILAVYKYSFSTMLAMLSFAVLTNIDMILVKHFFSSLEAGYYSIAQMIGKIMLFLPGTVSVVMFPKSVALHAENNNSLHLFKKAIGISTIFCGIGTLFCILFPEIILKVLTSKIYSQSIELVPWFAFTMSFYALIWLIIFFLLSIQHTKFIFFLVILSILQIVVIYLYHPTLKSILYILIFFSLITFLVMSFMVKQIFGMFKSF